MTLRDHPPPQMKTPPGVNPVGHSDNDKDENQQTNSNAKQEKVDAIS